MCMPLVQQLIFLIGKSIEDIHIATQYDADLQKLNSYITHGLPHTKDELENTIQRYWLLVISY